MDDKKTKVYELIISALLGAFLGNLGAYFITNHFNAENYEQELRTKIGYNLLMIGTLEDNWHYYSKVEKVNGPDHNSMFFNYEIERAKLKQQTQSLIFNDISDSIDPDIKREVIETMFFLNGKLKQDNLDGSIEIYCDLASTIVPYFKIEKPVPNDLIYKGPVHNEIQK
jgi:hypothetical protein